MYEGCCSFWHSNLITHVCSFLSVASYSIIYLIHFGPIQFCLFVQLSAMGQVSGLFLISIGCGINYPANTLPSQQLSCHYFMGNISWDFTMTPNSSSVGSKKKKKKKEKWDQKKQQTEHMWTRMYVLPQACRVLRGSTLGLMSRRGGDWCHGHALPERPHRNHGRQWPAWRRANQLLALGLQDQAEFSRGKDSLWFTQGTCRRDVPRTGECLINVCWTELN